jgi:hypothetical protein
MRFKWKGIGGGESPVRKFKDGNAKVWIDGVEVWKDKAIILDGQRSAMGEFLDDWGAPLLTVVGGAAIMLLGGGFLAAGIVSALGLLSTGVGFGFDWGELFNSDGTPAFSSLSEYNDDPNTEQSVTDWTAESDMNSSALLYVPPDDDEWRALLEVEKPPGPMDIKVKYDFTYRTGFANMGKKYRRTYEFNKSLDIDLDTPLQPIDIGMHTVEYSDERV